jgi:hypothetical protein
MVNYSNGKVYKIVPTVEHEDGDVYYGSTTKKYLSQRFDQHRSKFKHNSNSCKSKILFQKYGVENCIIVLLELVEAKSRDEMESVEAKYIINNLCVNKNIPLRTNKQYHIENKEQYDDYYKQYRLDNKEAIDEKSKQYYIDNKEQLDEKGKQYRLNNKEAIAEKSKQYGIKNREAICEKKKQYYLKRKAEKEAEALIEN